MLSGKKLLVQGAGRGNLGIVQSAINNGVYTYVTGMGGDYPCTKLADMNCYANIADPEAVLKVAKTYGVDGAVICCSDTGLRAIGRVNDVLGLTGLTEKAAAISSNKFLMKEKLVANGVRTALYSQVYSETELMNFVTEIGFPVIIKATDLQGSRGICIVSENGELLDSYREVMSLTHQEYCIVEEYIIGKEFGAQSFVYNGNVLFVLPHGDETIMCKTAVPVGHYMPYNMSDSLFEDTRKQVIGAINALGLNNCAVNVDLIERDGKAYIIELTGRVGANCLPELTSYYYGINYYDMILNTCLGESPLPIYEARKEPCATLARMIRSEKYGIVKSIFVPELPDTDIQMFIGEGYEIRSFTNCNDAIGQVIVKGKNLAECEEKMQQALNQIIVEL